MVAIMANAYPNPCDNCQIAASCGFGYGCIKWQIRYRYRQKQINAYARKLLQAKNTEQIKFVYQHPDMIRRYLSEGPCKGCKAESACNTPCPAYLQWWDARMEIIRKKVGV